MASPVLEISDLRLSFGSREIFNDFQLSLDPGNHTLLLGPSGSGKTSLINLVAGLLSPDSGTITVDGETMSGLSASARDDLRRRKIAVIFQTLRLISALSVRQNLLLAQKLSGVARDNDKVMTLLEAVGIETLADQRPKQLSQGEAQRAAIARALVAEPALLIADEPTSALDDANAGKVAELLLKTADDMGATLLVATHDARLKDNIPAAIELQSLETAVAA
ncbi:ATP-binding cassette domain-containing protein [Parasphingopyxis sp.]|uniref:ABC transporter ATP-binding protein n=1 Tax=Parasphingopyxis sp. TaxID=1920299 RepID=UPI0026091952|nr:ATP-binding cassette domain-containing protein [Parasphingopyxis sp.]